MACTSYWHQPIEISHNIISNLPDRAAQVFVSSVRQMSFAIAQMCSLAVTALLVGSLVWLGATQPVPRLLGSMPLTAAGFSSLYEHPNPTSPTGQCMCVCVCVCVGGGGYEIFHRITVPKFYHDKYDHVTLTCNSKSLPVEPDNPGQNCIL